MNGWRERRRMGPGEEVSASATDGAVKAVDEPGVEDVEVADGMGQTPPQLVL